jgi:hypothetical protein
MRFGSSSVGASSDRIAAYLCRSPFVAMDIEATAEHARIGRCATASTRSMSLPGRRALDILLPVLAESGVIWSSVCSHGRIKLPDSMCEGHGINLPSVQRRDPS